MPELRLALLALALAILCALNLTLGARGDWGFVLAFRGRKDRADLGHRIGRAGAPAGGRRRRCGGRRVRTGRRASRDRLLGCDRAPLDPGGYRNRPVPGRQGWWHGSNAYGVAFSPDGARLAAGDSHGTLWVWELSSG